MIQLKLISLLIVTVTLAKAEFEFEHKQNSIEPFIIEGRNATRGQFPFYVYLEVVNLPISHQICGASLISEQWIVTAAHCILKEGFMRVSLGSLRAPDTNEKGRKSFIINPKDIHVHPKYSSYLNRK